MFNDSLGIQTDRECVHASMSEKNVGTLNRN